MLFALLLLLLLTPGLLLSGCTDECTGGAVYGGNFEFAKDSEDGPSLDELRCVDVVTGDLKITGGGEQALEHLVHVLGNLELANSKVALPALTLVSGDVTLQGGKRDSLSSLSALEVVEGDLTIREVEGIESLRGLDSLKRVEGALALIQLPQLRSLAGADGLERVRTLELSDNAAMEEFEGFGEDVQLGGLRVERMDGLETLEVEGYHLDMPVRVSQNAALRQLHIESDGFLSEADTQRAWGPLAASRCYGLGFEGSVVVWDNPSLKRLAMGFREGDSVYIWDNPVLERIEKLPTFGFRGFECFELNQLPALEAVELQEFVVTVQRDATITRTGLQSLDGLVTEHREGEPGGFVVGCNLQLSLNPNLESIEGASLQVGRSAYIADNPALPECQVRTLQIRTDWPSLGIDCKDDVFGEGLSSRGNDEDAACM